METKRVLFAGSIAVLIGIGGVYWIVYPKTDRNQMARPLHRVTAERLEADKWYAKRDLAKAKKAYESIIERNANSKDKKAQDEVAAARMRVGYIVARTEGYAKAREVFLKAAEEYRGTHATDPEFGALDDQAAYQAAVCLAAQGKKEQAREEFKKIIKERPKSPVIYQAFRRLNRLGDPNKEEESLMQASIAKQEAWLRFEISVCGPKSIAYLLEKLGKPSKDYREIAKLCRTNDQGTTMQGMRDGLKALGVVTEGLMVNRKDFANLSLPAIWLDQDHYTVLTSIKGDTAMVFDTRFQCQRAVKLPDEDDPAFMATVLVIKKEEGSRR